LRNGAPVTIEETAATLGDKVKVERQLLIDTPRSLVDRRASVAS
jgi:hypothetical protein